MILSAPIRLLLADVDGTLVTQEKVLTRRTIEAARALREANIALALTSGRPPRGMSMLVEPLRLEGFMAAFNGGVIARPDLSVVETHSLGAKAAGEALKAIRASGLDAWVYTPDAWLIQDAAAAHVSREAWTVKFAPRVVDGFTDDDLAQAVKVVGVSDDPEAMAAGQKAVAAALGAQVSAALSQPYYLDVTHPLANKGEVVVALSRRLNIDPAQIATIGDMPNDTLMFAAGGLSIAMGNASDAVKARASLLTASNEDEGFALAVERFILPTVREARP